MFADNASDSQAEQKEAYRAESSEVCDWAGGMPPSKHGVLNQCCFNIDPASTTLAHH